MTKLVYTSENFKWMDITAPSKEELKDFSKEYELDYYSLMDCLEPNHLPKKEKLPNFTFMILRVFDQKGTKYPSSIQEMSNKIAIFFNKETIITVHRSHSLIPEHINEKYLAPCLINDTSEVVTKIMSYVLKSYEPNAIHLSEDIDMMEKQVFIDTQTKITLEELYYLKSSCRLNKKILNLTKDVIHQHTTTPEDSSALQDVNDMLQKLSLSFEETFEDATSLSNIYLSIVSQKTNDVMKLLTIFSVFFMPLTFIVGVYGMNFENIPELHWKYGYPMALFTMLIIGIVIFIWFKRKRII
ncbi:MAG: CorA family divalent cation transporter [Bacteroidota bacterium]